MRIQQNKEKSNVEETIASYKKRINTLKKELKFKKENLDNHFEILKSEIALEVGTSTLHNRKLLDFSKVKGVGTGLNKALLTLYLIYSEMISRYSDFKFPLAMDSFIKNEIADINEAKMFSAVQKHFINLENQTFFSVINKNLKHLDDSNSYKVEISNPILNNENYNSLQKQIIEIDT